MGKEKLERGAFPFLSLVKISGERRGDVTKLTFELPSPILEAVKKPSMYVKLNLFIARDLSSKHSLALYEVLKDYQNVGKLRVAIEDFRKLVGIEESQYKIFTMLKKRILDVAVQEVNDKTDLKVEYHLEREGRRIIAIIFRVKGIPVCPDQEAANTEILAKLKNLGIKEPMGREILQKHDEDYILANIRVVEEELQSGKKIRNTPAYLLRAFEVDFRPIETEFEKSKKQKAELRALELQDAGQRKQEEQDLLRALEYERNQRVEEVLATLDDDTLTALKGEYLASVSGNPIFKKFLESKGFGHGTIQTHRKKFIADRFLSKPASGTEQTLKSGVFN